MSEIIERGFSCSTFLRIRLEDQVLVTANKHTSRRGAVTYTPPGGADEWKGRKTKKFLENDLGLTFDKKTSKDLRLHLSSTLEELEKTKKEFERWYDLGNGRLLRPNREMFQELIQEEPIMTRAGKQYPKVAREPYYIAKEIDITRRSGQNKRLTFYYWAYHDVNLTRRQEGLLLNRLRRIRTSARLITEADVKAESPDGIARCCVYLFS